MFKQYFFKIILCCMFCFCAINQCIAQASDSAFSPIKIINPNENSAVKSEANIDLTQNGNEDGNIKTVKLVKNDNFYDSINATDKFVQCNIKASWEDFKTLVSTAPSNDFMYLSLAEKMSELGFFDIANIAVMNIKDKDITNLSIDAMKRFYYPGKKLKLEDELALAEIYSNISFNNQSSEATNDLLQKEYLLSNYDYANYLVALGSYKSNFFSQAAKYINLAIIQNPSNLNYYKLKAEILADDNKPEEALKTVEYLKKQNLYSYKYEQKIKSLEQFIFYKTKKAQWEKDYHLGYYYYIENDPSKAIRTLQNALSERTKANKGMIYALMSEIYFSMNEFEKATDMAQKAYKINSDNPKVLITLGDLNYMNKNYKQALSYYKKASSKDKKSYTPLIKEAQTYQKLSNIKKATEIYTKVLKTHSDSWEAYYNIALLDKNNDKDKTNIYLKKALAVNPFFENGWIELAKIQIDKGDYNTAQEYLANVFYIDENNFRYYYYQGLICQNTGDYIQAKYNFKKCLKLNSTYTEAQNALDSILKNEGGILNQESI